MAKHCGMMDKSHRGMKVMGRTRPGAVTKDAARMKSGGKKRRTKR